MLEAHPDLDAKAMAQSFGFEMTHPFLSRSDKEPEQDSSAISFPLTQKKLGQAGGSNSLARIDDGQDVTGLKQDQEGLNESVFNHDHVGSRYPSKSSDRSGTRQCQQSRAPEKARCSGFKARSKANPVLAYHAMRGL